MAIELEASAPASQAAAAEQPAPGADGTTQKPDEQETVASTEKEPQGTETQTETVEFDVKNISKNTEGEFVWVVDPDDPHSSVYKGKDMNELLSNIGKGAKEKDAFIRKLRSEQVKAPDDYREQTQEHRAEALDVDFPDAGEILGDTVEQMGIPAETLTWSDQKWDEYETEHGRRATARLEEQVKIAKRVADEQYARENVHAINTLNVREETLAVQQIVADADVEWGDVDPREWYLGLIKQVDSEKSNFMPNGVRRSGRITAAAAKELRKLVSKKVEADTKKKTDEDIATHRTRKAELPPESSPRSGFIKPAVKAPKTTAEALAEATKELKSYMR